MEMTSRPWVFQDLLDDVKELAVCYNPNSEAFTTLMMAHDFLECIPKAFRAANNAIYFDDSSDRLTALYDVCRVLKPDQNVFGKEYIEE